MGLLKSTNDTDINRIPKDYGNLFLGSTKESKINSDDKIYRYFHIVYYSSSTSKLNIHIVWLPSLLVYIFELSALSCNYNKNQYVSLRVAGAGRVRCFRYGHFQKMYPLKQLTINRDAKYKFQSSLYIANHLFQANTARFQSVSKSVYYLF